MAKMLIAAQAQGAVGYFKPGADINDGRWPVWEISEKILEPAHDVGNELADRLHLHALEQTIDQLLLDPARGLAHGNHIRLHPAHPRGVIVQAVQLLERCAGWPPPTSPKRNVEPGAD